MRSGRILILACMMSVPTIVLAGDHSTNPDSYFLNSGDVANSLQLIPAPPAESSARYAYDVEQYEWGKTMRPTERGERAVKDAELGRGWFTDAFSEAFGMPITEKDTPEIFRLLTNMQEDAGDLSTRAAKEHYMRPRPFMVFKEHTSTPDHEKWLCKNGSYPSGHTAIGWATALVLAEINPARQNEILQRGFEFGQSRVIVGAHFQSDVDMGRVTSAGVVARLHADKNFEKQLKKAKKEFKNKSKKK